jgi:GntR family transcriptional repressor for pyruvate dehydrogenase complex
MKIVKKNLSDIVVERIEKMILDQSLEIGEKLPSEQELGDMFGVSRTILREAMKTLKERGLVNIRVGDGAYVAKPEHTILKDFLNRLVILDNVKQNEVYEIRSALEVSGCGLAAERADDDEIERLEQIIGEMDRSRSNKPRWVELELEFHLTIAKASKNQLFFSLISPVIGLMADTFEIGFVKNRSGAKDEGITGHRKILSAIKRRDRKAAERAMQDHIDRSQSFVLGN